MGLGMEPAEEGFRETSPASISKHHHHRANLRNPIHRRHPPSFCAGTTASSATGTSSNKAKAINRNI
ncbi:hypothetical protein GGTG_12898 [Gaeumannomyces tritici R3-111a-1]|uniref:Uncharacterized protein n=1 Tax=Gaeumannomyces tritici (strain R3-111a-1) TaxID=644352 RepID=J3PHB9_GAET3|nr:hypothetical protein GGTG_12898 [Gaeumannomyces tritici R3-111a-1]EJT69279.1 hypothetical protein GGTG_12898 [Gaeumannomyces tritici R3-111a-1]